MNSLESTKPTAFFWHKRQTLTDIKKQRPFFLNMMAESKRCMVENRMDQSMNTKAVKEAIKCEVIHPQTLTPYNNFTFHTHPHNLPYPSDQDKIQTWNKLKKEYLVIGVVPTKRIVVFHHADNFENKIAEF